MFKGTGETVLYYKLGLLCAPAYQHKPSRYYPNKQNWSPDILGFLKCTNVMTQNSYLFASASNNLPSHIEVLWHSKATETLFELGIWHRQTEYSFSNSPLPQSRDLRSILWGHEGCTSQQNAWLHFAWGNRRLRSPAPTIHWMHHQKNQHRILRNPCTDSSSVMNVSTKREPLSLANAIMVSEYSSNAFLRFWFC